MEIKGKITEVLPLKKGTSAKGDWAVAQIVITFTEGNYETSLCLQNMKKAEELAALKVGQNGLFHFSVSSRKSPQGAWFTSCNCYKWEIESIEEVVHNTQDKEEKDDLPF